MPSTLRAQKLIAQVVVLEIDDNGDVIGEKVSQPISILRGTKDVWAAVDQSLVSASISQDKESDHSEVDPASR